MGETARARETSGETADFTHFHPATAHVPRSQNTECQYNEETEFLLGTVSLINVRSEAGINNSGHRTYRTLFRLRRLF